MNSNETALEFSVKNERVNSLLIIAACLLTVVTIIVMNFAIDDAGLRTTIENFNRAPSLEHWLGTDWLGRDMFTRIIKSIVVSLNIGLLAAVVSSVIALFLGILSVVGGKWIDRVVTSLVDMCTSLPHLVMLILLAFVMGGGVKGVIIAVALTHWPRLTRVIRAEILQQQQTNYVRFSYQLGKSPWEVGVKHMARPVINQFVIAVILMFPHAILHSAGLTFLGFGVSPHSPSIGILLSESMRQISTGNWWLAIFPGMALVLIVLIFDAMGHELRKLIDPKTKQD
jgi:peptide/nickel transport system permease protein